MMRAAHRAMLLAAAVGAELRNHGCPDLRFLNHTGRSLNCVRLHSTQQRLHRAKRCLLDGVAALARSRRRSSRLQVGAHLAFGNANDPFKRLALDVINHTVLVEPQPGVYRDLAALVAAPADPAHRIAVVNRAVSARDGGVLQARHPTPRRNLLLTGRGPAAADPATAAELHGCLRCCMGQS